MAISGYAIEESDMPLFWTPAKKQPPLSQACQERCYRYIILKRTCTEVIKCCDGEGKIDTLLGLSFNKGDVCFRKVMFKAKIHLKCMFSLETEKSQDFCQVFYQHLCMTKWKASSLLCLDWGLLLQFQVLHSCKWTKAPRLQLLFQEPRTPAQIISFYPTDVEWAHP